MLVVIAMLLLFSIPLTSLMVYNFSKNKRILINRIIYCCIILLTILAAFYVERNQILVYLVVFLPVLASLGYFLYRLEHQLSVMKTQLEYLSFYFPCLGIVLFTGMSDSPFFPEIFLFSLLFVVAHSGRRISFGFVIICTLTMIAIYWHGVATQVHTFSLSDVPIFIRILITVALMVAIPQLHRYLYNKRLKSMNLTV